MHKKMVAVAIGIAAFAMSAAAQTTVTNNNDGATGTVPVYTSPSTEGNSPISVSGSNVGIGTTAPSTGLDVVGLIKAQIAPAGDFSGIQIGASSSNSPLLDFRVSDNSSRMQLQYSGANTAQERLGIWGMCNGACPDTERFSVLSSGNVGIGTTVPNSALSIGNNAVTNMPTYANSDQANISFSSH